jgi:hypothetical protein
MHRQRWALPYKKCNIIVWFIAASADEESPLNLHLNKFACKIVVNCVKFCSAGRKLKNKSKSDFV